MHLQLRPHHLLCIQKFVGHGYDEAFTAHMTAVTAAIADAPDTRVTLVQGCDALCTACPHNENGVCTTLEKVNFMDSAVLAATKLAYGGEFPWATLARMAREKVFSTDEFPRICGSCQWFGLCKTTGILKNGGVL